MDIKFSLPITFSYHAIFKKKLLLFFFLLALLGTLVIYAIAVGSYDLPPESVLRALLGQAGGPIHTVVWNIRIPRIVAAIVSGWGLALSGIAFQSLLKNPLSAPSTLGVSQGATFGAAFAVVVFSAGGVQSGALRMQGSSPFKAG